MPTGRDAITVRRAVISDVNDEAAYRRCINSQAERTYWPGWEETRCLSVRWSTYAEVCILMAIDESLPQLEIVGTVEIIGPIDARHPLPRRCLLKDVWVAEPYRCQGIATNLVLAAEEAAREQGVAGVSLEVEGNNEPALALYSSMGYKEVGGDSPADQLMRPFSSAVQALPGWMRGTLLLFKELP